MKILALEKEIPGVTNEAFQPHLKQEAAAVWALHQADILREVYFRQEWRGAVLILECRDAAEAHRVLDDLPLVRAGLIAFEVIPLIPYPGLARLFADETGKQGPSTPGGPER